MSDGSERNRQRLGHLVLARRKELGLSIREAARRAGVMRPTWTGLEQGVRRTADYNFAAMERTLGWRSGSIEAVLNGAEPTAVPVGATQLAEPVGAGGEGEPVTLDPAEGSVVAWADIVQVLDAQLAAIGRADAATGMQRLWGAEQITSLARRLRPRQVLSGSAMAVGWADVVGALEATIAGIHQDAGVSSEVRLWGVEIIVDVAAGLKLARQSLDGMSE